MNYIMLDLEWNQPVSFESETFRRYGDRLLFEVIQIGAVKIDSQCRIMDEISINVQPVIYKKMNPMVMKMTHITWEMLKNAPTFQQVFAKFMEWCGEDCCFVTWGDDDMSVLAQNMKFHHIETELPPFYNLQRMYCDKRHIKGGRGLKSALEDMMIEPESSRQFHDAQDDAYYTGLIFQQIGDYSSIVEYKESARELHHLSPEEKNAKVAAKRAERMKRNQAAVTSAKERIKKPSEGAEYHKYQKEFSSIEAIASDRNFQHIGCPVCKRHMKPDYCSNAPCGEDSYATIAKCPTHGEFLVRYTVKRRNNGNYGVMYSISKATNADIKDVHMMKYAQRQVEKAR